MSDKRSPPRPTQKIETESVDRMARASTHGMESSQQDGKPRDSQLVAAIPRTLARTVRRVDLPGMNQTTGIDEKDWGDISFAEGSGGVSDSDEVLVVDIDDDEDEFGEPIRPTASRTVTVDDPLTMAMLAEVARSSKTADLDPATLDEAQRLAQGAKLAGERGDPTPPRAHPRLKRRDG